MKYDLIIASYNIEDLVPTLKGSGNKWGICPLPQHPHSPSPTNSFSVYWATVKGIRKQFFKCHGNCGLSGDVIDLAGYLWVAGYNKKMRTEAANALTGGRYKANPPVSPPPVPILPQWLAGDMLPPSDKVIEYAISRGITENQIAEYRIGTPGEWMREEPYKVFGEWMSMPTKHHNDLMGIKIRRITPGKIRYKNILGSQKGLWGYDDVWLQEKPVLLMKGEICAMVARRFGFLSCAPTGGESSYVDQIRDALALASVIVVGDNDIAGRSGAEKRATFFDGITKFPPEKYKGWDDWVLAEPDKAIKETQGWIDKL